MAPSSGKRCAIRAGVCRELEAGRAPPRFIRRLARSVATAGALRLALLYLDGRPIAAQLWIVWRNRAILYKLAHDRSCDGLSPGTVLTMRVLERLLDDERVGALDLGAGDDPYKRLWASRRRARIGLLAFDPLTVRGGLGIVRHVVLPRLRQDQGSVRQQTARSLSE